MGDMILEWLSSFEQAVNHMDFDLANTLFEEDCIRFGTRVDYSNSSQDYRIRQWEIVWKSSLDFKITNILDLYSNQNLGFCCLLWSNNTIIDGEKRHRRGRATLVFNVSGKKLLCRNSHFSEFV